MSARWLVFGLWAAAAASTVYWGLRLFVPAPAVPAHAAVAATSMPLRGDLSRLFGVDAVVQAEAPPPESERFQLLGVVAPRSPAAASEGVALIAVDGKPARAYRVGAVIDGQTVLKSVQARGASLGPRAGEALVKLDIPPPAAAATGSLPVLGGPAPGVAVPPRVGLPAFGTQRRPYPTPSPQAPPPQPDAVDLTPDVPTESQLPTQ